MRCFHPLDAWKTESGQITWKKDAGRYLQLRCGQCIGCKLSRSQDWAIRCMGEAQMHEENCFITLTYRSEQYNNGSLDYKDFQTFIKTTRYYYGKFRYFMGGEYGTQTKRPHYHACMFGLRFEDQTLWKATETGFNLYHSTSENNPKALSNLWPHGFNTIGALTMESAAYVARYCTKKITGENADSTYSRLDNITGEITYVEPEFGHMSLKPGIGSKWIDTYKEDVYGRQGNFGRIIRDNAKLKPPRYYDNRLAERFGLEYDSLEFERYKAGIKAAPDNTPERLKAQETVAKAKLNLRRHQL